MAASSDWAASSETSTPFAPTTPAFQQLFGDDSNLEQHTADGKSVVDCCKCGVAVLKEAVQVVNAKKKIYRCNHCNALQAAASGWG